MSLFPKNHLSHPSKIPVPTFDLDTDLTGCADRCQYGISKVCYVLNNPNENYPSRKAILKRNWDLINSDFFVSILTKQIRQTRINDFRFFSSGDFFNLKSIKKIIKVCENLPRVRFWIPSSRDDLLMEFCLGSFAGSNSNLEPLLGNLRVRARTSNLVRGSNLPAAMNLQASPLPPTSGTLYVYHIYNI